MTNPEEEEEEYVEGYYPYDKCDWTEW